MSTDTTCLYVQVSAYLRVVKHFRCQRSWMQTVAAFFIFQPAEFNHKRRSLPKSLEIAICLAMLPKKSGSGRSNLYNCCSLMGSDSTYPFPSKRNRNKIQYIQSNHTQIKVPAAKVLFDPREIRHCTQEILKSINRLRRKTSEKYNLSREWPWPFDHCSVLRGTVPPRVLHTECSAKPRRGPMEHMNIWWPHCHSTILICLPGRGVTSLIKEKYLWQWLLYNHARFFHTIITLSALNLWNPNNNNYTQKYCHLLHPETCTSSGIS